MAAALEQDADCGATRLSKPINRTTLGIRDKHILGRDIFTADPVNVHHCRERGRR